MSITATITPVVPDVRIVGPSGLTNPKFTTMEESTYYVVIWDNYMGQGYVAESNDPSEYPHHWHYKTHFEAQMALDRRYCD